MTFKLDKLFTALIKRPRIYLGEARLDLAISFLIGMEFGSQLEDRNIELFKNEEFSNWLAYKFNSDKKLGWHKLLILNLPSDDIEGLCNLLNEYSLEINGQKLFDS